MLLSTAALEKHKKNFDMFKHQMKLNRVKSYVENQQSYISQYKSPDSSDGSSVPESCENQEPLSSNAFSASISEIIRRKQSHSEATPLSSIHHQEQRPSSFTRKQPLLHSSFIDRSKRSAALDSVHDKSLARQKRHKSSSSSSSSAAAHALNKIPLQTKPNIIKKATHGMHLLQKFVSPNLEISRITMKSSIRQPKLGLFRKGKSSAQGKPIPDITDFNQSTINKENINPSVLMEDLSREPPSISKFFNKRPTTTYQKSNMTHKDKPEKVENISPALSDHYYARKESPAQYEAFTNNSFVSIYKLLDECQDTYHPYLTHNNDQYPAVQNYSHVKTPHSILQAADHSKINASNLSFLSSNKLPHPLCPTLRQSPTPRSFLPSPHFNDDYNEQPPRQSMRPPRAPQQHQGLFTPSWQVADSVASFGAETAADQEQAQLEQEQEDDHTTTANDDLELILQSQAMNMLGESMQQNDETIQNFWLNQPGFKRCQ
ncbi:hypothetical protein PS15m_007983 [Mucor circinelloides]